MSTLRIPALSNALRPTPQSRADLAHRRTMALRFLAHDERYRRIYVTQAALNEVHAAAVDEYLRCTDEAEGA